MNIIGRFIVFFILQMISFVMFVSANQGGTKTLFILPIASIFGLLSFYVLFRKRKK
jgi:hypothetical protein